MPASTAPRHPVLVTALMCAVATVGATIFAISPLLVEVAAAFSVPVARAGALLTVFSIAIAVVAPVVGLAAQRLPRDRVIVAGLLVFAFAWAAAGSASSFEWLLGAAALAGGATGAVLPAAYAYAGDLSRYDERAHVMGRIVSGWSLAILVVVPVMAVTAQSVDWRWAFGALALAASAIALLLALAPRPALAAPDVPVGAQSVAGSLRQVLRDRPTVLVLVCNGIDMGAFYAVYAFIGAEMHRLNGFGPALSGLVVAAYGLGLALVTFNGRAIDRIGKKRTAVGALLSLGVVLSALPWLAASPIAMAAGIVVWGCVQGSFFTSITALATEQIPRLRGVVTALLSASTYVGVTLYSLVAAALYQSPGYWAVGLASAAGCLVAALLLSRLPAERG